MIELHVFFIAKVAACHVLYRLFKAIEIVWAVALAENPRSGIL